MGYQRGVRSGRVLAALLLICALAQQTAATQLRMIIRCGSSSSEEIGKAN